MPDHLHWILTLRNNTSLATTVGIVKAHSARQINDALGRSGPVWQRGYFDHAIRNEEDLVDISRYIVTNPLRAGLVDGIGDYSLWDSVWI